MKIRKSKTCSLEITHDIIKGKWKLIIIWTLQETKSLSELSKEINGISQKMLLQHLHELQEYGIVDKKKYPGYPLKVEYFLKERGLRLLKAVNIFQMIGVDIETEWTARNAIPTNK